MHPLYFLLFVGFANALFIPWRRTAKSSDVTVLNFASMLEQMESEFYSQALQSFTSTDFAAAGFVSGDIPVAEIQQLANDENLHLDALQSAVKALGGQPITGCKFDFSLALTNVNTMITFAQLMENVGVSAYLGAASSISDPALLSAAASIMTVEARHQTVMNLMNAAAPVPQAFDLALNPSEALSIIGQFMSGCSLNMSATPSLWVSTQVGQNGTLLEFQSLALNGSSNVELYCQLVVGGANNAVMQPADNCLVPAGVNGPMLVLLTDNAQGAGSNSLTVTNSNVVAGPSMIIVIEQQDPLGELVRPGESNSTSSTATSSTATSSTATSMSTTTPATASSFTTVLSTASASTTTTTTCTSTSAIVTSVATSVASLSTSSAGASTLVSSVTAISIALSTTSSASTVTSTSAVSSTVITSAVSTLPVLSPTLSASGAFTTTISPSQASAIIASAVSSLLAATPSN